MPIYAQRPLQTLIMPVSSSRPKRKSRGDAYPEDNGGGGGGAGIVGGGGGSVGLVGGAGGAGGKDAGTLQKENNAPAATTRKKRREDGAERPPSKVGALLMSRCVTTFLLYLSFYLEFTPPTIWIPHKKQYKDR